MTDALDDGTWVVKPGMDDASSPCGRSSRTRRQVEFWLARAPRFLRDATASTAARDVRAVAEHPRPSEAFRVSDMFRDAVTEMGPLLDSFETLTLDEIEWA